MIFSICHLANVFFFLCTEMHKTECDEMAQISGNFRNILNIDSVFKT